MKHRENGRRSSLGSRLAILCALLGTGCYKATFVEDPTDLEREPTHSKWSHHYLFGTVGDTDFDAGELCPNGASVVRTGGDAATGFATVGTLGIYAPRKVKVTCAQPKTASNQKVTP